MPRRPRVWKMEVIKRGMLLEELAQRVGYSLPVLSRLANGWTEPNEKLRKAIPEILGLDEKRAWRRL
jgi:ribosome-binding protein aMBF1 (putative translation factor)